MGLAERRGLKDFQENHFPKWQTKIDEAAQMDVLLEVDWASLAIEDESHLYVENWPLVYFEPLLNALKSVARDDLGRQALAEGLKKVTITHDPEVYSGDTGLYATFQDGVLALRHAAHTNVDNVKDRTEGIVTALEKSL